MKSVMKYGDSYEDFEMGDCIGDIEAVLEAHAILGGSQGYSSVGALLDTFLNEWVYGGDEPTHPRSLAALRMAALIEGVAHAVVDRLEEAFDWDEEDTEEATMALYVRRRVRRCKAWLETDARCPQLIPVEHSYCQACRQRLDCEART